ncbi:MAG: HlyD family type I secretion periplasmic adaptor subunit [Hyphomicrobium sp.]
MTTATETKARDRLASVAAYMIGGVLVAVFIVGGVTVWAATTEIAGAVLAPGTVVVESNLKKVQHPTGGVVGEIRIKEGARVKTGDLLIRLDETITRANMQLIAVQLEELYVREARLSAERDDQGTLVIPDALVPRKEEATIAKMLSAEQSLLTSRQNSRAGQKGQLRERIDQLGEEISGVSGQIESKATEIKLIGAELDGLTNLERDRLVTVNRMNQLRREAARLKGEFGQLKSSAAQAKGKISEVELQILRIDQDARTEVVKELREVQSKINELRERRVAAEDQLKRVEIRSPQDGLVHQLSVHTVGGVVNPGEPIMLIVPNDDRLMIETRIAPQSIDQVHVEQLAVIRFSAFNQATTPEINAHVKRIAADLSRDQQTGETYFAARLEIPPDELLRLGDRKLLPGMPADVQIRTENRTVLSYLLKPLTDQTSIMFR